MAAMTLLGFHGRTFDFVLTFRSLTEIVWNSVHSPHVYDLQCAQLLSSLDVNKLGGNVI